MTKKSCFLATLVLLCIPCAAVAQSSSPRIALAERSWPTFWRQFTTAINKKDHASLLRLMPENFSDDSGGLNGKEWLQYIDENERKGSWRDLQKSVARGARTNKEWSNKGVPTKVTRDNHYYFEFRKDGKWYFAGVVGD